MFSLELLQAINDWQRGGSIKQKRRRGETIKRLAADLPINYRQCGLCCFRQISLSKQYLWKLGDELSLVETISSWTADVDLAKSFKGGVPPVGWQGVIFVISPNEGSIVLNLMSLYSDPEFNAAIDEHRAHIHCIADGIDRYRNTQSEIIIEIESLAIRDIHGLGGYSSGRGELAKLYFNEYHHRDPTDADLRTFDQLVSRSPVKIGADWIVDDAKDRVVRKLLEAVEVLRPLKRSDSDEYPSE